MVEPFLRCLFILNIGLEPDNLSSYKYFNKSLLIVQGINKKCGLLWIGELDIIGRMMMLYRSHLSANKVN
jgi:hypothetical protein